MCLFRVCQQVLHIRTHGGKQTRLPDVVVFAKRGPWQPIPARRHGRGRSATGRGSMGFSAQRRGLAQRPGAPVRCKSTTQSTLKLNYKAGLCCEHRLVHPLNFLQITNQQRKHNQYEQIIPRYDPRRAGQKSQADTQGGRCRRCIPRCREKSAADNLRGRG